MRLISSGGYSDSDSYNGLRIRFPPNGNPFRSADSNSLN